MSDTINTVTSIAIVAQPVSAGAVLEALHNPAHGGQALFFGAIRNHHRGRKVRGVSYDCYVPLARKTLETIVAEARSRYGESLEIGIAHATGFVGVGELGVGIAVSAPHRAEAFDACRYIIDELKHRVPIWKKEHYEDGESDWLPGQALCEHAAPTVS